MVFVKVWLQNYLAMYSVDNGLQHDILLWKRKQDNNESIHSSSYLSYSLESEISDIKHKSSVILMSFSCWLSAQI